MVFEDGLPLTTKTDTAYHGFGVRSIKYIADKYKGTLLMREEYADFEAGQSYLELSRTEKELVNLGVPHGAAPTLANVVNIIVSVVISYPAMKFWIMPK